MPHEIFNEINNNPVVQNNPIVSSVSFAAGWIGSGILLFVGSIGEATDVIKFAGAVGGLVMLFISARRGYIDNQIKKTDLKIKKLEALKLEKEINGKGN